jgi:ATP-binding cassette subfamily B protein
VILVLKDGQLVEQGRYDELVAQGGLFAELDGQGKFVADAEDDGTEESADAASEAESS